MAGSKKSSKKKIKIGTRAQVWHGTAEKTSGGLKKSDLTKNKRGKIVSKKQQQRALKNSNLPELEFNPHKK